MKLKPVLFWGAIFGSTAAAFVISVMNNMKMDSADAKLNIIYLMFFSTVPIFAFIVGMIAECKRSKLLLSLRRLGMSESAFWTANCLVALSISWLSALLCTAVYLLFPTFEFIKRIDFMVLFLMQATVNLSYSFLGIFVSAFFSDQHVVAVETAFVYISSMDGIARNVKDTGLCSLSCEYNEIKFTGRLWKNILWPALDWANAWNLIYSITNPIPEFGLERTNFTIGDVAINTFTRINQDYLERRIASGYGILNLGQINESTTVFGYIFLLWCYIPILAVLAWYLHQVIDYQGYTLPLTFPFSKQYWRKANFDSINDTIELKNITKEYSTRKEKAVDSFTQTFEPGNVYTILGHNGE
jgi:F0F1-type ATP synthase membrane subunit c/vacuolar-type H+-ATPase subunit K